MLKLIKRLFCEHLYINGEMDPFVDEYGNHSATYTCQICGKKKKVIFYKRCHHEDYKNDIL